MIMPLRKLSWDACYWSGLARVVIRICTGSGHVAAVGQRVNVCQWIQSEIKIRALGSIKVHETKASQLGERCDVFNTEIIGQENHEHYKFLNHDTRPQ